jgi:hypothetical protein
VSRAEGLERLFQRRPRNDLGLLPPAAREQRHHLLGVGLPFRFPGRRSRRSDRQHHCDDKLTHGLHRLPGSSRSMRRTLLAVDDPDVLRFEPVAEVLQQIVLQVDPPRIAEIDLAGCAAARAPPTPGSCHCGLGQDFAQSAPDDSPLQVRRIALIAVARNLQIVEISAAIRRLPEYSSCVTLPSTIRQLIFLQPVPVLLVELVENGQLDARVAIVEQVTAMRPRRVICVRRLCMMPASSTGCG